MLHALGLIDDARPLGARAKFSVMALVAIVVALMADVRVVGGMTPPWLSITLTAMWIVVIVNAFNFLDNMDGLSAGVATINFAFLAICGVFAGQAFVPGLAGVCCGATLGFLAYNFPPARIFMGDAGSLVVGYMIAIISIMTTYYNAESGGSRPPYALAMPLVVLAVPLYDFVSVVGIRILEGRSPFRGDQRHFSHRLVDHGLSRRFAVLTIYLATTATGLAATLLPNADLRQTVTIVCLVMMVLGIIAILEMPPKANS
ncbi:MAG: undecaprenyl/decaprenyl-phosphate alpha-N-acetylglucosaminyl 1-phosphate transferase [Phycisphaerales bacterium]|nr:undecaprenyl/decaprenyl-phosphate alpha-N-acetylglucosaminyl 1-phosphate transferase [Phycisphaerales bacterium]